MVTRLLQLVQLFFELLHSCHEHVFVLGLRLFKLIGPVIVVIVDKTTIGGFMFLSQFHPVVHFLEDLCLLHVEMSLYHSFKTP